MAHRVQDARAQQPVTGGLARPSAWMKYRCACGLRGVAS